MEKQLRIEFGDTDEELSGQWAVIKNPKSLSWRASKELSLLTTGAEDDRFGRMEQMIAKYVVAWHILDAENDQPLDNILPSVDITVMERVPATIVLAIVVEIKKKSGVQNSKNSMTA